jgi:hypothetical protein
MSRRGVVPREWTYLPSLPFSFASFGETTEAKEMKLPICFGAKVDVDEEGA